MLPKQRIFLSAPADDAIDANHYEIKYIVMDMLRNAGFDVQYFHISGLSATMSWSFGSVKEVMSRCQGAFILSMPRWKFKDESGATVYLHSEYNHFEGALAIAMNVPLFIASEKTLPNRGITYTGGGEKIHFLPADVTAAWIKNNVLFNRDFNTWAEKIKSQRRVFLGYCSNAQSTANAVSGFLGSLGVSVKNYALDFRAGDTILEEIEQASIECTCGIFLFTKDDMLVSDQDNLAAPRDNVIFEAGYFMKARGKERVLVIREEGAKMPADLGGNIYLSLADKNDIRPLQWQLEKFLEDRL